MAITPLRRKNRVELSQKPDIQELQKGAITQDYSGDVARSIHLLNQALATELVCVLRYQAHYYQASGILATPVAQEFLKHASEEQEHAHQIARRIHQLNGTADLNPETLLSRSHASYETGETLIQMIQQNLIAERIAIDTYRQLIRYFGENDPTSRRIMETILAQEEEHATELAQFLTHSEPT